MHTVYLAANYIRRLSLAIKTAKLTYNTVRYLCQLDVLVKTFLRSFSLGACKQRISLAVEMSIFTSTRIYLR